MPQEQQIPCKAGVVCYVVKPGLVCPVPIPPGSVGRGQASDFRPRVHPETGASDFHTGQDFPAPYGTVVRAPMQSNVTKIFSNERGGNQIILSFSYLEFGYAHVSPEGIHVGQLMRAGDPIGVIDHSGTGTGPHLHFTTRTNGIRFDPMLIMGGVCN